MAKKKPGRPKKPSKRPARSVPTEEPVPELPDRRAMEGVMQGLLGKLIGPHEDTPLSQAQELMYQAFESPKAEERVKLARKALEICPDCADAYVLLAEHATRHKEALELFEKGVAAGERALGPKTFRDDVGHFWGMLETRPYMRAREGLANVLWMMGRRDEAINHLQEMLRLNPNDNQGLRYTLAGWLLAEERDEELARLLKQYDEGSANWAYTKALVAFREHGDTPESRRLLQAAHKVNKHVPAYLLGEKFLPQEQPGYYSPGDQNEAILYAGSALSGWKGTPGVIAWLKANSARRKATNRAGPKAVGPTPAIKKRLNHLPQIFDVWQADIRPSPQWVEVGGEVIRPWFVLVTSRSEDLVLGHEITEEPPTSNLVWDVLVKAAMDPAMGDPHRPTELQVRPDARWDELKPHLEEIGLSVVPIEVLDQLDLVFEHMAQQLGGEGPPGLLETPGIEPEQVAGFYRAAAEFYRKAPWRKLGYEAVIKVECKRFESSPWYAVVMGQSGMMFGLALYDELSTLKKLWAGKMSDEESARATVALTVTFSDETEVAVADLDAATRLGWEVAGPEAYPSIFRKERGMSMRPPLAWELQLMEACLLAIPAFVAKHPPDDLSRHETKVPTAGGELKLALSWIED